MVRIARSRKSFSIGILMALMLVAVISFFGMQNSRATAVDSAAVAHRFASEERVEDAMPLEVDDALKAMDERPFRLQRIAKGKDLLISGRLERVSKGPGGQRIFVLASSAGQELHARMARGSRVPEAIGAEVEMLCAYLRERGEFVTATNCRSVQDDA